ncbi:MAG: helix-turn-helix domain-containing protein [Leptolyngbyaceae cyanobacterium RM1_1_2]|nr:helix-turn-helix domain-containing protein [Leptolyngbyaceae cyanobacterium RM1_1_2]
MANLDSDQLEQLQEIGTYLYQARQELSASLEEIATRIFIRPLLLRAIEEADPEPLPEPVFIQGFIRRYGDALGLDGLSLAKNFSVKTAVAHLSAATPTPYVDRPLPPAPAMPEIKSSSPPKRRSQSFKPAPLLAIGAFALVVVGAVVVLPSLLNTPANTPADPPSEPSLPAPEATAPESASVPPPESTAAAEPDAIAPASPVSVSINLTGDSWMRVVVDGQSQFEGLLTQGTQETWEGQQEITITAGNAGAVSLSANGEAAAPVGSPGQVQTVTFTPAAGE